MYPRAYGYDVYNQLTHLYTFKDKISIPLDVSLQGAATTWNYDQSTGLLLNKRYADGKGPDYTYDTAGRLLTRTRASEVAFNPWIMAKD